MTGKNETFVIHAMTLSAVFYGLFYGNDDDDDDDDDDVYVYVC